MSGLNVRVRVAHQSHFSLRTAEGDYFIGRDKNMTRYIPYNKGYIVVDNIRIGIDFHWQQEVTMHLPGVVEVVKLPDGSADLFNILPIDTYLGSVISSEMSAEAPMEFLKAHAIVSRSWVLGKILHRHDESDDGKICTASEIRLWEDTADHEGFDVCGDDHCQRYQGVSRVNETVARAVEETSGVVLKDNDGDVIDARFSKCCGGTTEVFSSCWQDTDKDYLESFADPYCNSAYLPGARLQRVLDTVLMKYDRETSDYHEWTEHVKKEDVEARMKSRHNIDTGMIFNIRADRRGSSGRITRLCIEAEKGTFYIGKELMIRRLLSEKCLYSSAFEIERNTTGDFMLRGRGWGHGVGLCQIGAAVMASEGASCEEILRFYYPNTKLEKI